MSSISTSNVTSGFIDLATFDEIEKYMYGGPDATAYFVRETRKSTWFTQVPVILSRAAGQADFNQDWSSSVSRAGDYMLQNWLRLQISAVTAISSTITIRWTKNLMHNLIKECAITFNDLVAARFDNFHLDFWAAFTVPAGKQNGYHNMIGNIPSLIYPVCRIPSSAGPNQHPALQPATLNLPLPLFYGRDSGVALPTAALPYNDMRINFSFRDWTELLIQQPILAQPSLPGSSGIIGTPVTSADVGVIIAAAPTMNNVQVWANYAIVSNDERKRMACAPRDILIEQVQTAPTQTFIGNGSTNYHPQYDIRFSHAIKVLFFAVRNKTNKAEWSNYTTVSPVVIAPGGTPGNQLLDTRNNYAAQDPIDHTSLIYENTARLSQMGSDYFSLVNPYFNAPVIPYLIGYHSYSYSLDFISLDPMGSTNYGKLTNVSISPSASVGAQNAAGSGENATLYNQQYQFIVTAVNNNIIRISGGALGKNGKPKIGRCFSSCGKTIRDKHYNYHQSTITIS